MPLEKEMKMAELCNNLVEGILLNNNSKIITSAPVLLAHSILLLERMAVTLEGIAAELRASHDHEAADMQSGAEAKLTEFKIEG